VEFNVEDFTSHCPVTGQPDFAKLEIVYVPDKCIIETKSLKLFLQQYRNVQQFNERIVDELAEKLFKQAEPKYIMVRGKFALRGGISVTAEAERRQ
jgi:7-cyano-7-deazaguanine reductase